MECRQWRLKEGKEAEFLEIFARNQRGTRQEIGNLRFDVLRDPEIRTRFYAYEVYTDEAALEQHRTTEHYHRCVEELEPIMSCSRSKKIFEWVMPERISDE